MKKQWVLAGILASALGVSDALAQHQTPNQQPNTATAPTAPAGDLALGKVSCRAPSPPTARRFRPAPTTSS